jgi:diguanylate cyclase (GGDEF)-like protein
LDRGNPQTLEEIRELNSLAWNTMLSDPQEGLDLCTRARKAAEELQDEGGIAESCLNQGWCYIYLGLHETALAVLQHALDLYTETEDLDGCMKCMNAIGVVYHNISKYESALEYYTKSLALAEASKNEERKLTALNNLGEFYQELGNHEEALSYFEKAREIAERTEDVERLATVLVNTGLANRHLSQHTGALECLERATELVKTLNDNITHARCYTAMGLIYLELGRDELAESYHRRSIDLSKTTANRHGELEARYNLGELLAATGRKEEAVESFETVLRLAGEINARIYEERSHKRISEIEAERENYAEALGHFRQFYRVEKQIFNEQAEKRLENLISQHEIERSQKEAEIYKLRNIEMKKKSSLLESSYQRIKEISEIGQKITASLDIEQIAFTIFDNVKRLMDADSFGIALYHSATDTIEYRVFIEGSERIPVFTAPVDPTDSYASWCIIRREPVFINDSENEYGKYLSHRPKARGRRSSSLIYLPLTIEERVIGVITVQSFAQGAFTIHHLDLLKALGSYIAIALENSTIHEQVNTLNTLLVREKRELESANRKIAHMANHDNLTGLPNRRLLYELVGQAIPQARRQKHKFALFYIDLDNFKPINDELGHDHGDEVLKIVADRLTNALRKSDTVARIGGDEFVTIIGDVPSMEQLGKVAEKTIRSLAPPITVRGVSRDLGMSIGISLFPDDAENFEDLLKKADEALYTVKDTGKNGYCFYKRGDQGRQCIHLDSNV